MISINVAESTNINW